MVTITPRVAEVYDGVSRVLTHDIQPAQPGGEPRYFLAHGHVQVTEVTPGILGEKTHQWSDNGKPIIPHIHPSLLSQN